MKVPKKILLVDDDPELREALTQQLRLHEEFLTETAGDAATALGLIKSYYFDILILDVGLPDMDGRELCRVMRRNGVRAPIVMLTGTDSEADTILGLDAGANDYVTKPFRLGVLLARLRAFLRQHELSEDAVFTIGAFSFHPGMKLITTESGKKKIRLTEKETAILKFLLRSGDRAVGRDQLLTELWGYNTTITTHTLETHIYRLRQKIELDSSKPEILITDIGGYRLMP